MSSEQPYARGQRDTVPQLPDSAFLALLDRLKLEDKVRLLTAQNFWSTLPLPQIGLRSIVVSDGPSGVRGQRWDERDPSLGLPSATALASSWDPEVARSYGEVCAAEARRKNVDVVLGPTINMHRSPRGGRHFEAFSEDPYLAGSVAAAYVGGLQDNGVGATPKHYVANDSETDRFTLDVRVDERTLREVYLQPFEHAVHAGAWLVMSSYNSINGITATENDLLETPLKSQWAFDGVVISDWTAVRSIRSAGKEQDLVFPGPRSPWSDGLLEAVRNGEVDEAAIDRKVVRILRLAARVGALEGFEAHARQAAPVLDGKRFAREAAVAGSVLLHNDGILPIEPCKIAVIGDNALIARSQGGGSATVVPEHEVSPLEGLRIALGEQVTFALGAVVSTGIRPFPVERLTNPVSGAEGLTCQFLDATGNVLREEQRRSTDLTWLGNAPHEATKLALHTRYIPKKTGSVLFAVRAAGHVTVSANDVPIVDEYLQGTSANFGDSTTAPGTATVPLHTVAETPIDLRIDYQLPDTEHRCFATITFGTRRQDASGADLITDAVRAAAEADVAVVVAGTNSRVEAEGFDRASLTLPGRQDELIESVAVANPKTVVVVNAGAPVIMPWRNRVSAILLVYFGGQEMGHALADVLLGKAEPGGRLPTTWPAKEKDVPVLETTPSQGKLVYSEGVHIGYRAWLRSGSAPAYPFGHGLGYTQWSIRNVVASGEIIAGDGLTVSLEITNTGFRRGKYVAQVYLSRDHSTVDRPIRWLAGFAPVAAESGETVSLAIEVPASAFRHWDEGWRYEPGAFWLSVGTSVHDLHSSHEVVLRAPSG